ncbi:hypothetical protein [Undibacterium terreum]|uniref:Uncharacterized protein n=1 Tax=Undibacterium terreum TaxID=1224302 RepID=A0A916V0H2_9BURK|nr:hypothetical protein [Undibacterium terreum]GGC98704.1 hypothetical protein GCM10011396_52800 [Undibacterium terreum]
MKRPLDVQRPIFALTIAANSGFYVLEVKLDDSCYPVGAYQTPVIAWAIEMEFLIPYPVTLEGAQLHNEDILCPNGSIERASDCYYPNLDEWLTCKQSEYLKLKGR